MVQKFYGVEESESQRTLIEEQSYFNDWSWPGVAATIGLDYHASVHHAAGEEHRVPSLGKDVLIFKAHELET